PLLFESIGDRLRKIALVPVESLARTAVMHGFMALMSTKGPCSTVRVFSPDRKSSCDHLAARVGWPHGLDRCDGTRTASAAVKTSLDQDVSWRAALLSCFLCLARRFHGVFRLAARPQAGDPRRGTSTCRRSGRHPDARARRARLGGVRARGRI